MRLKKACRATLSIALIALGMQGAHGQADYPNLQGGPTRVGHNADPANYGSGRTLLQWFVGSDNADPFATIVVDDDYPGTNAGTPGVTYSNSAKPQIIGKAFPSTGSWNVPPAGLTAANSPYLPVGAPSPYHYTTCVPSAVGADPAVAATGTASQWTWTAPFGSFGFTESYALYVWLPIGYTQTGAGSYLPAQRYFVYHINFANGQTLTDVVDTYASGYGWVRLGGGGYPTNRVFQYNGKNPISVSLYNTIPRDSSGNLLSGTSTTANKFLVYADAFKCVPMSGYYTASPTSSFLRNAAGAPLVDAAGDIDVAPQSAGAHTGRISVAFNQLVSQFIGGVYTTTPQGVVKNYVMDPHTWPQAPAVGAANGVPFASWTWSAAVQSQLNATLNQGSPTAGWTPGTVNTYQGTGYETAPIASTPTNEQTVSYIPLGLQSGDYGIYAYLPGNKSPESYGTEVTYHILVGGTIVATGTLNESVGGGWVQLGTQQWPNNFGTNPGQLSVLITNLSANPADIGKLAYASAVKFVSPSVTYAINSTPVHAQVKIQKADGTTPVTQVVIVADENGRIHCLDEAGNGDGTTTEYWSYPSTPDLGNSSWVDPNLQLGIDGPTGSTAPSALMPTQFNLSTAVVRNADASDPHDRLYIASANGRIYCIDMQGRGDYIVRTSHPGSTARLWTYPNDYPKTQVTSTLGNIQGSLVYGDATNSSNLTKPTIFVPAAQGRIYSLDALGDTTNRVTTLNWTFPTLKTPTLPPIVMTPNLSFGNLYFGTLINPNDDSAGAVHALNAATGAQVWYFNGVVNGAASGAGNLVSEQVGDFVAGPASASAALLAESSPPYPVASSDSIYFINSNNMVYGFNAETGSLLTDSTGQGFSYHTNELGVISTGNLGIDFITTYDRTGQTGGVPRSIPIVMIPDTSGQIYGLFANIDDYNVFSLNAASNFGTPFVSLEAFGYNVFGSNMTSLAFSNGRMIGADDAGYMYVWDNDSANYGTDNPGSPPNGSIIPPNVPNPYADAFRYIHLKPITRAGYQTLTTVNKVNQGAADYPTAVGNANTGRGGKWDMSLPPKRTTFAFEWGETAYILVYDFPYQPANATNAISNGEQVNIRLSQNGRVIRNYSVSASQFANNLTAPTNDGRRQIGINAPLPTSPTQWYDDGYAVIPITLQGGGANAVPPGPGLITADITTSALSTGNNTTFQEIAADPSPLFSRTPYLVNNPLAFAVTDAFSGNSTVLNPILHGYGASPFNAGATASTLRYDAPVNNNGNLFSGTLSNTYPGQYLQSLGFALDGQTQNMTMYVYDRSLMSLLRPEGLDNVRADVTDLAWQGGASTIYNPLPPSLYPNFEDTPVNYPNNSLDYPNISHDRVAFTMQSNGVTSNPALELGSQLNPPTDANGNPITPETANLDNRILVGTPMQISLDVPRFQPAVDMSKLLGTASQDNPDDLLSLKHDSTGNGGLPQGMFGLVHLFVDSNQAGFADDKAYRQFHLSTGVEPDRQLAMGAPTVSLGALPTGTGYGPLNPYGYVQQSTGSATGPFSPWTGPWTNAFQPFTVQNLSNINLLNVTLAKASTVDVASEVPWIFTGTGNDANAVLDGSLDMWSNLDPLYAPPNPNNGNALNVFSQKARVADGVGSQVLLNPVPRLNPNLNNGVQGSALNPSYPVNTTPKLSLSVPFGFPSGDISSAVRVIDDTSIRGLNNGIRQVWERSTDGTATEPATDPMVVSATVREARLTNSESPYTVPFGPNYIDQFEKMLNVAPTYTPTYSSPAAIRDGSGSVILAFGSNDFQTEFRNFSNSAPPSGGDRQLNIYSVSNAAQFGNGGFKVPGTLDYVRGVQPSTPLRDLDFFAGNTSTGKWLTDQTPGGYPKSSIIPANSNGSLISQTETYDSPSFPVTGSLDPITQTDLHYEYMAFIGNAQRSSATGRIAESHVFLTQVKSGAGGTVTMDAANGAPWNTTYPTNVPPTQAGRLGDDPLVAKGKPTVAQTSTGALLFYPVTQGNNTGIHYSRFSLAGKGFGPAVSLSFGTGFSSVTDPKATIRPYTGLSQSYTSNLVDLAFSGKLRGQANSDVYLAQMRLNNTQGDWQIIDDGGKSIEQPGAGTPFAYFAPQVNELLASEGGGKFRARGVEWDRTQGFFLYEYVNGTATDLLIETTRNSDRQTGVISYDTHLGGKVYIDPEVGTVTFTQGIPAKNVDVRLTYTPGFLRINPLGVAGYSAPTFMYENNYTSDVTEWYTTSGGPVNGTPQDARYVFVYGRAGAVGSPDVTSRPFMASMRLGISLPARIAVNSDGTPYKGLRISGNRGPYQLDPAGGKIYFTGADEDNTVSVTYTGVNEATNSPYPATTTLSNIGISLVPETGENPVLIDNAVNEGNLCTFLDPFTYPGLANQRPALFWMFYTSTRTGSPDIYMQTVAPRFAPVLK